MTLGQRAYGLFATHRTWVAVARDLYGIDDRDHQLKARSVAKSYARGARRAWPLPRPPRRAPPSLLPARGSGRPSAARDFGEDGVDVANVGHVGGGAIPLAALRRPGGLPPGETFALRTFAAMYELTPLGATALLNRARGVGIVVPVGRRWRAAK